METTTQRGAGTLLVLPPPLLLVHGHEEAVYSGQCQDMRAGKHPQPSSRVDIPLAVLVKRVREVVERAREAEARGEAITLSKKSLALPTCQNKEERQGGKGKRKASLPLLLMEKRKKRARVVLPVAVTPKVEFEKEEEDKACRLATAIEASKAALVGDDLAGPSCQVKASQDVGNRQEDEEQEKEAEVRPKAILQAHS
ncbi:hypothetical protein C0993_007842 [Termitomyces sp. T159_Od127]|nr:hypothetical protein C0993_007842 [Termitomyces sp. T159_Od127]